VHQPLQRSWSTFRIDAWGDAPADRSKGTVKLIEEVHQMCNSVTARVNSSKEGCGAGIPLLLLEAEKQLAAFHQAVLTLHGPEAAHRAAEDWLVELETAAQNEPIHWRRISRAAAGRLVLWLTNNEHPPTPERSWRVFKRATGKLLQCTHPCEAR
jgi:hypothetical protein